MCAVLSLASFTSQHVCFVLIDFREKGREGVEREKERHLLVAGAEPAT